MPHLGCGHQGLSESAGAWAICCAWAVLSELDSPIEATALLLAAEAAHRVTGEPRYLKLAAELPKTATGKVQRAVLR